MLRPVRTVVLEYAGAVGAVVAAVGLRFALDPLLGDRGPFGLLPVVVLAIALYAGRGPALLAIVLGAFATTWCFVPPRHQFAAHGFDNQFALLLYLIIAVATVLLADAMRNARRRAERLAQTASAERDRWRVILDSIADAVLVTDESDRIVVINPVAEELTGCARAKALGQPISAVLRAVDPETREVLERPARWSGAGLLVGRDGAQRFIEQSASLLCDHEGRMAGTVLVIRDTTAQRRSQQEVLDLNRELHRRVTEFQTLLELLPIPIAVSEDAECRHIWGNPAICRLFELPLGTNLSLSSPPGERPPITLCDGGRALSADELPMQVAVATDRAVNGVRHDVILADGRRLNLLDYAVPIHDEAGKIRGCLYAGIDVTAQEQTQKALRQAELRWRTLTEMLPNLVWSDRPDGQCDWLSSQWGTYTGIPEDELLGLRWLEAVIHPDDRERTLACWTAACRDEGNYDLEYRIRRHDGEYRWFKTRGVPVRDEQGRITSWFGTCTDIEDAKRVEHALRESEATLRAFYDNTPMLVGIVELTDGDDILHVYDNPATSEYFGAEPGATTGRRASQLGVRREAIDQWMAAYREAEARGGPVQFEFEYRDARKHRWLSVTVSPIGRAPSGRARFCYLAEDFTERRRLAAQLEAERSQLDAFLASTTVGLGLVDSEFRFLRVNGALAALDGPSPETPIGRTVQEMTPLLWPLLEPGFRRVLESGEPLSNVEVQSPRVCAAGTVSSYLVNYYPVRQGERTVYVGFAVVETTEARLREARLREAEERLRLALEAGRMGTWDWDVRTGAIAWSDNLEQVHGLPAGSFDGTVEGFHRLIHPDDRQRVQDAIGRALQDGSRYDTEFRVVRPDGSVGWMSGTGQVFTDESGRAVRMIGVGMDVTARKRDEEALREADRRKNEFLATLAHELRNPLAPVRNAAQLLASSPAVLAEFGVEVDMIRRQIAHLARLVDDLLDVARIERGKVELKLEDVELAPLVQHVVEAVRSQAAARRLELEVVLPTDPIRLTADPTRLEQVLDNLLTNAVKYSEPGGRVTLVAAREDDRAVVRVRDTGIGIPPDKLPLVFEMFAQVDGRTERAQGGLGIGLGLVRALITLHGGSITARSDGPGTGSEFVIRLPAHPASRGDHTLSVALPSNGERDGHAQPWPRQRVLVVDDNEDAANSLAKLLSRVYKQDVQVVHDGPHALEVAEAFQPEIVILDIGLPGMDGYEVARQLRARDSAQDVLIVALTGWGQEQDRQRSRESGFDLHMVKPIAPESLGTLLERRLSPQQPAQDAP